jgi:alkylhydroperoxidase family enzyme
LRRLGVAEDKIQGVQRAIVDPGLFTPRELASIELADKMTWSGHAVDEDLWKRLLDFFDQDEIVEVVCSIGLFNYFNRVNDALHMEITR